MNRKMMKEYAVYVEKDIKVIRYLNVRSRSIEKLFPSQQLISTSLLKKKKKTAKYIFSKPQ